MNQERIFDRIVAKSLILMNEKYPDPRGSVLTFGSSLDAAACIKTAEALGFRHKHLETSGDLIVELQRDTDMLLLIGFMKEFPQEVTTELSGVCERLDKIHIARIYTIEGKVEETGGHYKIKIYSFESVADTEAADRVSQITKQLFDEANREDASDKPISESLRKQLEQHGELKPLAYEELLEA